MKDKIRKLCAFFRDWEHQSTYLRWMIARTKPFMGPLMLVFGLNLVITVTGIGSTVITKYIIDGVTGSGAAFTEQGIILLIALTVLSIAISAAIGILTTFINERYAFAIRSKVYGNILRGLWQKIMSFHSGDVVTRVTSDIDSVANGISSIIPNLLFLLIRLIIAFGVLFYYDRFLALTALVLGPVGVLLSLTFSGRLKKYQVELNKTESEYRSFIQETVENISVIKTFEQEPFCDEQLSAIRDKRLKIIIKRNRLNTAMNICIRMVFNIGYLVAFGWGIYRLSTGSITYGTMTIFLSLVSQVQVPIMSLGSIIPQFIAVLASTGRILEIDSIHAENRTGKVLKADRSNIGLKIQGLTFGYGKESVLEDVSLDIKPNEIIGVMGYSGCGKTTLIRLILSLVCPDKGRIMFYDDTGASEDASAAARRFISYVPQGNTLISGTIADNLLAGKQNATEADMWRALDSADALLFVRELEDGLHTRIGENGMGLSEGQAQRIAIARAIIKAAPVLVLDEATSALDAQTEERIIKRMYEGDQLQTCIVITHRRSMLSYCTRALEIEQKQFKELNLNLGDSQIS